MHHIFIILLSVEDHLVCFHFLTNKNPSAINIAEKVSSPVATPINYSNCQNDMIYMEEEAEKW